MNTPLLQQGMLPSSTDSNHHLISIFSPDSAQTYPSPLPTFYPSIILSTPSQYAYFPESPKSAESSSSSSARREERQRGNQAVLYSPWCPDTPPLGETVQDVKEETRWTETLATKWEVAQVRPLLHQDEPSTSGSYNDGSMINSSPRSIPGCSAWTTVSYAPAPSSEAGSEWDRSFSILDNEEMDFEPRSLDFPSAPKPSAIEMFDDTPLMLDYDSEDEETWGHGMNGGWSEETRLRSPWFPGDIVGADEFLQGDGMLEREKRLSKTKAMGGMGMTGLGFGP